MRLYRLIFIILLLASCSGSNTRLSLLEKELRIKLPNSYVIIENTTEGVIDFEIKIKLKFSKAGLKDVTDQIKKTKYFEWADIAVLSKYPEKETLVKQDSTINGIWKTKPRGFYYEYYRNQEEPVYAEVDTIIKTLTFSFVHL